MLFPPCPSNGIVASPGESTQQVIIVMSAVMRLSSSRPLCLPVRTFAASCVCICERLLFMLPVLGENTSRETLSPRVCWENSSGLRTSFCVKVSLLCCWRLVPSEGLLSAVLFLTPEARGTKIEVTIQHWRPAQGVLLLLAQTL